MMRPQPPSFTSSLPLCLLPQHTNSLDFSHAVAQLPGFTHAACSAWNVLSLLCLSVQLPMSKEIYCIFLFFSYLSIYLCLSSSPYQIGRPFTMLPCLTRSPYCPCLCLAQKKYSLTVYCLHEWMEERWKINEWLTYSNSVGMP